MNALTAVLVILLGVAAATAYRDIRSGRAPLPYAVALVFLTGFVVMVLL